MKMGPVEVALCKIGAVYLFVSAASSLSWTVYPLLSADENLLSAMLGVLLSLLTPLIGGVVLWNYADRNAISGRDSGGAANLVPVSKDDLADIGIALVGLYAMLFGIVAAVNSEILAWSHHSAADENSYLSESLSSRNWSRRISYVVQILLGFFLVRCRKMVASFLSRPR